MLADTTLTYMYIPCGDVSCFLLLGGSFGGDSPRSPEALFAPTSYDPVLSEYVEEREEVEDERD